MKFKIDENLPQAAAELLQSAGFETQTVRDEGLAGKADEVIAAGRKTVFWSRSTGGSETFAPILPILSLASLFCAPGQRDRSFALTLLRRLIPLLSEEPLAGALWIVEPDRIRFHSS